MLGELEAKGYLDQEHAVREMEIRFGEEFVYLNDNGNPAIDRRVLAAFRTLTEGEVVWDRSSFVWRKREAWDPPGRQTG